MRVIKLLLKWRDYVARIDDESPAYMLPNHILFQIGRDLPKTKNELRDSCRAQVPPAIQKYQDEILHLIQRKLDKKTTTKTEIAKTKFNVDFSDKPLPLKKPVKSQENYVQKLVLDSKGLP